MAYVNYTGLKTPNEVLEKMAEYVVTRGYTIIKDPGQTDPWKEDLNVYDQASVDGEKFVFMDRTETYYVVLRSSNGTNIFGTTDDTEMLNATPDVDISYYGIGAVMCEGYSRMQRWYNQYMVPVDLATGKNVQGVWIPVPVREDTLPYTGDDNPHPNENTYTLWCNNIVQPSDTLIFTVVAENVAGNRLVGYDYRCVSMVFGNLYKYDQWEGGAFYSASSVPSLRKQAFNFFVLSDTDPDPDEDLDKRFYEARDSGILPILSSGSVTNTFLRMDIDDAITDARGNIRWASSGTDNITGKPMSLPVRVNGGGNGQIPHYVPLQSTGALDWGRDINTLNGISLEMPMYMAVRVDPDSLDNYAGAGQVAGVYYCCSLNMQSTKVYEHDYPKSGQTSQIFSNSVRRGRYGFDAIAVRQDIDDSDSFYGDITTYMGHETEPQD